MEGIRYRKSGSDEMGSLHKASRSIRAIRPPYRFIKYLAYIVIFSLVSLCVLVMVNSSWPLQSKGHRVNSLDKVSVALGVQERVYAVVIDAGSTGSRVLAFTFLRSLTDNSLKLEDELWEEVKPGLSSYADNPKEGAKSLLPLLSLAQEFVPSDKHSSTAVVVKATAGLRLLPEHKADALIQEVSNLLSSTSFHNTHNSVGIMDGKDEGIFSWFTVNYLMDRIGGSVGHTLVALDLGGGSTQISFVPADAQAIQHVPSHFLSSISLLNKAFQLFTHSYLGLGLMAGRASVLTYHKQKDNTNVVHSPCINPIVNKEWAYGDQTFVVKGPLHPRMQSFKGEDGRLSGSRPIANFDECFATCSHVITKQVDSPPKELGSREVIAFSYFFDRAAERGLIDPFRGGAVSMKKILQEAKLACEIPNTEQPFACLDMSFIGALLSHGYAMNNDTKIQLSKRIDGHEISWALGLAFHIINNGI